MLATSDTPTPIVAPPFPLTRSLAAVMLVLGIGLAGGFAVLFFLGDDVRLRHGPSAVWLGIGCALGSALAFLAVDRAAAAMRRPGALPGAQGLVTASLAGFFIRAVLAGVAALVAVAVFGAERRVAAGWLIGWYVIFLVLDVTILRRFFRLLAPPPAPRRPQPVKRSENSEETPL
jgi:hypothetical protein